MNPTVTLARDPSPDDRAQITEQQNNRSRALSLLISVIARRSTYERLLTPASRLTVHPLLETDASLGITNPARASEGLKVALTSRTREVQLLYARPYRREDADVPQVYLTETDGDKCMRLLGFQRVLLQASESKRVT